jgi:hypothetical protein
MEEHVDKYHAFKKEDLVRMVGEHDEVVDWIRGVRPTIDQIGRDVTLIINEIDGRPSPTAGDPDRREEGLATTMKRIEATMDSAIARGVTTRREWTNGQWAFAAAVLTAIAAFVVRGWF